MFRTAANLNVMRQFVYQLSLIFGILAICASAYTIATTPVRKRSPPRPELYCVNVKPTLGKNACRPDPGGPVARVERVHKPTRVNRTAGNAGTTR
jgi:hypothetical protein